MMKEFGRGNQPRRMLRLVGKKKKISYLKGRGKCKKGTQKKNKEGKTGSAAVHWRRASF